MGKNPAWLSKDPPEQLRWKRKLYGHRKQGQAGQEDYSGVAHHYRVIICMATAWLEFCCPVQGRKDC